MIFIVWPSSGQPLAVARAVEEGERALVLDVDGLLFIDGDDAEIFALGYRCPLAALGLEAGFLDLSVKAVLEPRLPIAHAAFESQLVRDRAAGWSPIDPLDVRLETLSLKGRGLSCPSYEVVNVAMRAELPRGMAGFVLLDSEDEALVGIENGDVVRVRRDVIEPAAELLGVPTAGGYRDEAGNSYFYGNGKLMRAPPGGPAELVGEISLAESTGARRARISGPHDGSPFELFITDTHLRVLRFDGFSLREVVPASTSTETPAAIQWIGSGEAIAALNKRVLHLRTGESPKDITPGEDPTEEFYAAGYSPALGPLLGSSQGHLRVREGDSWRIIDGLPAYWMYPYLSSMGTFERGVVNAVVFSYLSTYDEERGFCRIDDVANSYKVLYHLAPTCSGFVAFGNERNDAGAVYFYRKL
jgi:hypothetical protein